MDIKDSLLQELLYEASLTRVMLERVPEDRFEWQPHPKSMTLGRLAGHLAEMPAWARMIVDANEFIIDSGSYQAFLPTSKDDLLRTFDGNIEIAQESMGEQPEEHMLAPWQLKTQENIIFEMPRSAVLRNMVLNHMIHHRGQLSVYLRLNDVPVPAIYGPSADEQTMGAAEEAAS